MKGIEGALNATNQSADLPSVSPLENHVGELAKAFNMEWAQYLILTMHNLVFLWVNTYLISDWLEFWIFTMGLNSIYA